MTLLLEILADAEAVEEKVLVFSQSLVTLDLIERALGGGEVGGDRENWCRGCDYFRMDGSTSVQLRQRWSDIFNDVDNKTLVLKFFLRWLLGRFTQDAGVSHTHPTPLPPLSHTLLRT
jgi:SNF2 family DNA or RNA helicase